MTIIQLLLSAPKLKYLCQLLQLLFLKPFCRVTWSSPRSKHPNQAFPETKKRIYSNVDLFAGKRAISRAFSNRGLLSMAHDLAFNALDVPRLNYRCLIRICLHNQGVNCFDMRCSIQLKKFDITYYDKLGVSHSNMTSSQTVKLGQDINTAVGFVRALISILKLKAGGLVTAGVVCSSWITVNRCFAASMGPMLPQLCSIMFDDPGIELHANWKGNDTPIAKEARVEGQRKNLWDIRIQAAPEWKSWETLCISSSNYHKSPS